MELTKSQKILKALVEDMLRRGYQQKILPSAEDIETGIQVLKAVLPPGMLFVIADTSRLAEAFGAKMERKVMHITNPEMCKSISKRHIVRLYTGRRTPNQQACLERVLEALKDRDIIIWHIGEW